MRTDRTEVIIKYNLCTGHNTSPSASPTLNSHDRPWRWVLRRKARLAHALDAKLEIIGIFKRQDVPSPFD